MAVFHEYESRDAAAAALCGAVVERLRAGIAARGQASLVLSGGSSPVGLYEHLRRAQLDWTRVMIVPSDERWVALGHPDSNEGALRATLLQKAAARANLVGLYRDATTPGAALDDVTQVLHRVPRPFDAVVLGMGSDGHTASLFPDARNIADCLESRADCVVPELPDASVARISLSLRCLRDARALGLLFFGADKRRVYERAARPGPTTEFPVRGVMHQDDVPLDVYWSD